MSEPKCEKLPYISCIKIGGRPILPPVMYPERIVEMRHYKQLAMQKEMDLMDRKRERHKRTHATQENLPTAPSPKKCALPRAVDYYSCVSGISKLPECASNASSGDDGTDNAIVNNIVNAFKEHLTLHESHKIELTFKEMSVALSGCDDSKRSKMVDDSSLIPFSGSGNPAVNLNHDTLVEDDPDLSTVVRKMSVASLTDEDDQTLLSDKTVILSNQVEQKKPDHPTLASPVATHSDFSIACVTGCWVSAEVDAEDHFTSPGTIVMEGTGPSYVSHQPNEDSESDTISIKVTSDTPTMAPSATCSKSMVTDTTPPSLASTNLAKYLHMSPDELPSDPFRPGTSASLGTSICAADLPMDSYCSVVKENCDSNSGNSTVKANSDCVTEISAYVADTSVKSPTKRSAEDEEAGGLCHQQQKMKVNEIVKPFCTRVRRSSYTLECPSPALMAHAQLCEEQGISMVDDMTSMSSLRRNSAVSVRDNGEVKSIDKDLVQEISCHSTDVLHLPLEDMDVVNENKQRHLENYLHNLSRYSEEQETLKSCPLSADNSSITAVAVAISDQPTSQVPEMPETPRPPKLKSYEDMLRDQAVYIEQLTLKLKEEHKRQMALLMAQQEEDLSSYFHDVKGIEGFTCTSRTGSLDDLMVLPSTSTAAEEHHVVPNKEASEQESAVDNALAIAHKYQLLLHIKSPKVVVPAKANEPSFAVKYVYVSARVKGYLTRRLLRTERVQGIIKTIRDTLEFALYFHSETPIKTGKVTPAEANLHKRILVQLTGACYDFHDIFFKLSKSEQMAIISHDRVLIQERIAKSRSNCVCSSTVSEANRIFDLKRNVGTVIESTDFSKNKMICSVADILLPACLCSAFSAVLVCEEENDPNSVVKRNLSSATLKVLERKKVKSINDSSHASVSKVCGRSKSAASWSSSPKRRKVSSDSIKSAVVRPSRPRTTSPCLISRPASAGQKNADQRSFRNARRNLSSIYAPDAKHVSSSSRMCRSLRPLSSGMSPSISHLKK